MRSKNQIRSYEKDLMLKPGRCGSGWTEWIVADTLWWLCGVAIRWCCRWHDVLYEIGGSEWDRLQADIGLQEGIMEECMKHRFWKYKWFRRAADKTADGHFYFVQKWGAKSFNYKHKTNNERGRG